MLFLFTAFHRSAGFSIYTYNNENVLPSGDHKHLIYHHNPLEGCPSVIQRVNVNSVTQGIMFFNERHQGYTSNCPNDDQSYTGIELCEVKIMGMLFWVFFKYNCPSSMLSLKFALYIIRHIMLKINAFRVTSKII